MKIPPSEIRKIIKEELEDLYSMDNAKNITRLSRDSADDQIDSLIIKFETEATEDENVSSLEESLKNFSLLDIIKEADEEAEEATAEVIEDEEEEVDDPADSADVEVDEPPEALKKPQLDVDKFSKKVARLALNHESLLDIPTVIINRAVEFLIENYDQEHVDKMIDILNNQFDFNLGKEREPQERAVAVGAFGGSEGGGGPAPTG